MKRLLAQVSLFLCCLLLLPAFGEEMPVAAFNRSVLAAFQGRELRVRVQLQSAGSAAQPVRLELRDEDGRALAARSVRAGQSAQFAFVVPEDWQGLKRLTLWHGEHAVSGELLLACDDLSSKALKRVDTSGKQLAITFCAFLSDHYVAEFLDLLDIYDVRATFFLSGMFADRNPDTVREIVRRGHEVASHGWAHINLTEADERRMYNEILRSVRKLEEVTGTRVTLFRPPYSYTNEKLRAVSRALGCEMVIWSVDSRDWDDACTTRKIIDRSAFYAAPGEILQYHFGAKTLQALEALLPRFKQQGLELVTVSQLLMPGPYSVDADGTARFVAGE